MMLFLYGIIMMYMGKHYINHAAIQSSNSLALDSYATELLKREEEIDFGEDVINLARKFATFNFKESESTDYANNKKWYMDLEQTSVEAEKRFIAFLAGETSEDIARAEKILKVTGIVNGLEGFDFSETRVDDGDLIMKIKYDQSFVFDFNGLATFPREVTIKTKMWSYDGSSVQQLE